MQSNLALKTHISKDLTWFPPLVVSSSTLALGVARPVGGRCQKLIAHTEPIRLRAHGVWPAQEAPQSLAGSGSSAAHQVVAKLFHRLACT